ncbi:MAG TPA: hypothetical protein VLH19_01605 [Patescibacteria group bacterium]|nr:hypothetical protein [Patescibacteria group bacterium]
MNPTLLRAQELWNGGKYGLAGREIIIFLFAVDSIGSVFVRGAIWFGIALVILASTDSFRKGSEEGVSLKSNLGFFFLFLILGGVLTFFLFGVAPFVTASS